MILELKREYMKGQEPTIIHCPGTWIAGGAIRRWFMEEDQNSDIDIFCKEESSADIFISINNLTEKIRNSKMVMFSNSKIQLILDPKFENMEDCIKQFDYTICQFAYDGNKIIATLPAIICTLRKSLSVNKIQPGYEIDSLRRAFKYQKQGYSPCIGTIRDLAKVLNEAPKENMMKYDQISPERWD